MTTTETETAPAVALTIRDAHIVSWKLRNVTVTYDAILRGLDVAGLPRTAATAMLKSNAFRRALKEMCEDKLARQTSENDVEVFFQITKPERKVRGANLEDVSEEYVPEALLGMNKESGTITVYPVPDPTHPSGYRPVDDAPALKQMATDLLDSHLGKRNTADVSRIVMRLCDGSAIKRAKKKVVAAEKASKRKKRRKKGEAEAPTAPPVVVADLVGTLYEGRCDLFPIKGGVYVAFPSEADFLDRIDVFLAKITPPGRREGDYCLDRLPLSGDAASTATMARTVSDGLEEAVSEYERQVAAFCDREKKGESATAEMYENLSVARLKLDGYREFLADKYAGLVDRVSLLSDKLTQSLEADASEAETVAA